jgi:hypothetical protein
MRRPTRLEACCERGNQDAEVTNVGDVERKEFRGVEASKDFGFADLDTSLSKLDGSRLRETLRSGDYVGFVMEERSVVPTIRQL